MFEIPIAQPSDAANAAGTLLHYCEPGGADLCIGSDVRLREAVEMFRRNEWLQVLAVVDADGAPVGLVLEQDVRAILYNPYGHALLDNPAFNRSIAKYVHACPIVDAATPPEALFERAEGVDTIEGIIVVAEGRFRGLLSNRTLVRIAGRRAAVRQQERLDRLELNALIGRRFLEQADNVSALLDAAAGRIDGSATVTASRIAAFQTQNATIAAACQQTDDTMHSLVEQGTQLAATMQRLREDTLAAQDAAERAVALADADGRRTVALEEATRAIDLSIDMIRRISREAHLLSINAAIEAARFGAEGGGFGVVARELRQFASNTRQAIGTIDGRVEDIRAIAGDFTAARASVGDVVRLVDSIARGVDKAVGAEAEAAGAHAGNVAQAKVAIGEIRESATRVATLVDDLADGAGDLRGMAHKLGGDARAFRLSVGAFVAELNAAA